jgi:hypothetical protein
MAAPSPTIAHKNMSKYNIYHYNTNSYKIYIRFVCKNHIASY